jgi:hypothetical protein
MLTTYVRFTPPRRLSEYVGQPGPEATGERLTSTAYDAIAQSKVTGQPPELVVIGEYRREDGKSFLDFGVPTEHIEAVTEWRWDGGVKRLRLVCPLCELKDGKHAKDCDRG